MSDWVEFTAKTVNEAITSAILNFKTTSDKIEYEVLEKETSGFMGLFAKPAKIRAKKKKTVDDVTKDFLENVLQEMNIAATIEVSRDSEEGTLDVEIKGSDMGILIGKRGQTLDSLQYLTSLVVNKESDTYLKVKVDTENYRQRRKDTLENLAKNIAFKVKKTRHPVTLEPMNSFERRIIHSALQNDKYVETHSEGDEPYRKVVITLKKGLRELEGRDNKSFNSNYNKKPYRKEFNRQGTYHKDYKPAYKREEVTGRGDEAGKVEDNQ